MCFVGILISIIAGCTLMQGDQLTGILVMAVGCLLSWVGSFIMYGFGEIVDCVMEIRDATVYSAPFQAKESVSDVWYCTDCGQQNNNTSAQCKGCGKFRS